MSTETPTAHQSAVTIEEDSFSQTLESYTSLVNDLLAESDVTDDDEMNAVRSLSSQLIDEASEIEARVEANEEAVSETGEAVATTRKEQAQVRSRVTDVEQAEADETDEEPVSDSATPPLMGPTHGRERLRLHWATA
jgi:predicted DNA-binding helix-hairpin-helix protein